LTTLFHVATLPLLLLLLLLLHVAAVAGYVPGIRHRRNVASQRVFGEAGHAVVSAFEHVDTPAPATYRGKDVVLLATQQRQQQTATAGAGSGSSIRRSRGRQGAAHDSADVLQQQLQRQLSKHLATQVGLGSIYNRAAERFSSDALAAAWQQLQSDITMQLQHRQQEWQQQQQQKQPAAVAVQPDAAGMQQLALQQAPQQLQQQQQQRGQKQAAELQLALSLTDAAQVACLAHVLPEHVTALALTGEQHHCRIPGGSRGLSLASCLGVVIYMYRPPTKQLSTSVCNICKPAGRSACEPNSPTCVSC
jgi:hypothetical protein